MSPDATVILPTWREPRLAETLASTLRECGGRARVVVVDNAARDEDKVAAVTPGLTARHPEVVFLAEPKPGSYAARVRGVQAADGDVLVFLDSDCVPEPGWFQAGLAALDDARVGMAAGRIITAALPGSRTTAAVYDELTAVPQEHYVRTGAVAGGNLFVRRAAYEAVGGYDSTARSGEDGRLLARIRAANWGVVYAPEAAVVHPARTSWRELRTKSRRVYRGLRALHAREARSRAYRVVYAVRAALPWPRIVWRLLTDRRAPLWMRPLLVAGHAHLRLVNAFSYVRGGAVPRR